MVSVRTSHFGWEAFLLVIDIHTKLKVESHPSGSFRQGAWYAQAFCKSFFNF